ncbi:TPA: helix-turn-helix transcriptional regulator, partial [Streptococcus pyogenes]|nr:helix-turn-helix transcriptional regulator [Streptococcus pyogenes]HES0921790.1 helix-turn-helix transcriptional regulator [Streptococcus pyogenes]HES7577831.1 helix-turn-helix transcriptional regulator [Streptococcus pyogenes]
FNVEKSDLVEMYSPEIISATSNIVIQLDKELKEPRHSDWISYGENLLSEQNTVEDSKNTVVELFSYNYYDHAASAGTGQYLNDVQVEKIELPVDYDADFVIPVYGDSMEPKYHSGDYVFVKLSVDLTDGDIGVFEYYGDAYIKQLLINAEGAFLHSLNSKYDDIPIDADSDFRIIGEVVGSYSGK